MFENTFKFSIVLIRKCVVLSREGGRAEIRRRRCPSFFSLFWLRPTDRCHVTVEMGKPHDERATDGAASAFAYLVLCFQGDGSKRR